MKTKLFIGIMSLAFGIFTASCNDDDDYSIATGQLTQGVSTGSADVTANTAILHGTANGLQSQSASAYEVGFYYGSETGKLTNKAAGSLSDATINLALEGLVNNQVIYYQAYLKLQGRIEYKGEEKSLVTTDAKISTADASSVDRFEAILGGSIVDYPASATCGVVIASSSNEEDVRAGLAVQASELSAGFALTQKGLLPNKTYYYAAYLNLGAGVIYGDVKSFTTKEHEINVNDDFVDLGLSTKWCKYNLGTTSETEFGGYFAFGNMDGVSASKTIGDYTVITDIYKTDNDVVFKTYGKATIPTADEYAELFSLAHEWVTKDGVSGVEFTGLNGNKLFLPAAGSRSGSKVTEVGEVGKYLTGSVNEANVDFAISYSFGSSFDQRAASPRYAALAVRPVTVAKNVLFDKTLLYKTWYLDIDADAKSKVFDGPMYYYGTDDSWATVTNNEPCTGNSWCWAPKYADNTWICEAKDYGSMTLNEDGTVIVVDADGVKVEGTFTVNETDKTITLEGVDILGIPKYNGFTKDPRTNLKIFSLTKESAQIAILRDPELSNDNAASLAYNYITGLKKNGFAASLIPSDTKDWTSAALDIEPIAGNSYTIKYEGSRTTGGVYVLDIANFAAMYPKAFIRVDDIKADGVSLKYDANKIRYGDIEGKGTYRIELFNCWGATGKDSPFRSSTAEGGIADEPALAFNTSFEVSFTIVSITSNCAGTYVVLSDIIDKGWADTWNFDTGNTVVVKYDNFLYSVDPTTINVSYPAGDVDYSTGPIMTFLQINGFPFMQPNMTFNSISADGTELTGYDVSKIVNSSEGANYRYELWNMYGKTEKDCAFGTPTADGEMPLLGFTTKLEFSVTMNSLFPLPKWD